MTELTREDRPTVPCLFVGGVFDGLVKRIPENAARFWMKHKVMSATPGDTSSNLVPTDTSTSHYTVYSFAFVQVGLGNTTGTYYVAVESDLSPEEVINDMVVSTGYRIRADAGFCETLEPVEHDAPADYL